MLAIIGTVGVPASYGGFETLVENLLNYEKREIVVYCSSRHYTDKQTHYKNARLKYVPVKANGVQSIPYDCVCMLDAVRNGATTLLVLGVSGALILPLIRRFTRVKVVTNIDGLEWKREKWSRSARSFLKWSEGVAVRNSHVVIADNAGIASHVRETYDVEAEVIAYGGDHAVVGPISSSSEGYALSLCRIEPENNCHLILDAFSGMDVKLSFVGNWSASEYGRRLKTQYSSYENIEMLDPIYEVNQLFELRNNCTFYVHGHSAGGTNPSLVEMMFFNKPILCYDCIYNRATTEGKAEFFDTAAALCELVMAGSKTLDGREMGEIAQRRYTWESIRNQYWKVIESAGR